MDPIFNAPNTVKGIEVLWFEEAEVTKMRGGQPSFATFGPMSVLYVPHYNRFILQINDWRYPLMRRFSINSLGSGSYNLPGANGASFKLNISKPGQALNNLDAILEGTRKLEASPDDKLVRKQMKKPADTGPKEVITETIKQAAHKVQNKIATFKTGTKNLTSTKKRINLKDIKTKNFKKTAHSKIKKDFFKSSEKLSNEFLQKRRDNLNLSQARDLEGLRKSDGPAMYLPKEEIEETILLGKDIFIKSSPMDPTLNKPTEKTGFMTNLKEGMRNIEDTLRGGDRLANTPVQTEKMPVSAEGMTHYQG